MNHERVYNFSAGPAMMPEEVLEEIQSELLNYRGCGMSVMELSHRSKVFQDLFDETEQALRQLMGIPSNYKVLFLQGGGTLQFSMVPLNLMNHGAADYIVTGAWSQAAQKEACKFGIANVVASSADRNYTYLPDCSDLPLNPDADYVYICENETIHGTTFSQLPNTKGKALVSDQSSMFLSKPCNVADYGLIFAGVQKNVGPAGMSIVIIRDDLISQTLATSTPTYLQYAVHASSSSMYNTPNCWSIYVCGKVFQYLIDRGGLAAMQQRNEQKANLLYDYLDHSRLFRCPVEPASRSMMNVPFVTPSKELDAQVVAYAQQAGLENLKGHRSVGGLRASIFNAMPLEGVQTLIRCLQQFEQEHPL